MNKLKKIFDKFGTFEAICYIINKSLSKLLLKLFKTVIVPVLPIKDRRICFESKPDFSDNSKALFDYMIEEKLNLKYEIIWLVSDPALYKNYNYSNVRFVKSFSGQYDNISLKALYYEQTSKFIFYTHSAMYVPYKKRNQMFINLWHGCGYKAAAGKSNKQKLFDYLLVPGEIFVQTKSEFFNTSKENIIPIGYPRYDAMLSDESDVKKVQNIKQKLNVKGNKLVIWMPTFRKTENFNYPEDSIDNAFAFPVLKSDEDLKNLDKFCNDHNISLLIKKHRNQIDSETIVNKLENIMYIDDTFFEENNFSLYELLKYTDALLTDYSSIAIDYLLLNKQIGFTLEDYESYAATRGFVFENPLDYMPGAHIYNIKSFYDFLRDIANDKDIYQQWRFKVKKLAHNQTSNYSKRIIDYFNL